MAGIGQNGRIPASRLESGRSVPDFGSFGRNPVTFAGIRPLCRNLANLDSDETVWILAFISDSGYSSRNPIKVAEILFVSDRISSPVIFIG
jgi:hypothetical protein